MDGNGAPSASFVPKYCSGVRTVRCTLQAINYTRIADLPLFTSSHRLLKELSTEPERVKCVTTHQIASSPLACACLITKAENAHSEEGITRGDIQRTSGSATHVADVVWSGDSAHGLASRPWARRTASSASS